MKTASGTAPRPTNPLQPQRSPVESARPRRVRLPGLLWRYSTAILIVCLLGSDPKLDFWSTAARADCPTATNSSTDTVRITTFSYDFDGHLTQVNSPEGYINYGYDLATGRHISTCTYNSAVMYDYDELGRLRTVTATKRNGSDISPEVTTYTYDDVGNRATVTLPNGVVTAYHYDELNRLTNLTHTASGGALLGGYSYQLDATGRRTNAVEILKTEDTGTPYITNTLTWAYDGLYRLTNETSISTSPSASGTYTNQYVYDLVGNRLSREHYEGGNLTTVSNVFDANDELLREVTFTGTTANETNDYVYDANGSLTAKTNIASGGISVALYEYNLRNKLSAATINGTRTTYLYNDQGIRVNSTTSGWVTWYHIDANNPTGYAQVIEDTGDYDDVHTTYVIGDDVIGQCGTDSSAPRWLLYDGHGSTRQLCKNDETVSSRYNYDAYGQTLGTSSGTLETSLLYCGEQLDSNLGMYNLRARFYDPSNGRFNARDTFEGNNEDPQSLHKYAYCGADPVQGLDPSGHLEVLELLVVVGIILTAASFLYHSGSAVRNYSSGNVRQGSIDLAWAIVDLMFLGAPVGPALEAAFEGTQVARTSAALLQAGVRTAAVWGYASSTLTVAQSISSGPESGGGAGSGGGGGSLGQWGEPPLRSMSPRSAEYERRVANEFGDPRPNPHWEFNLGGRWFDGVREGARKLIEAKGPGYEQLFRDLEFKRPGPVGKFAEEVSAKGAIARRFGYTIEYHAAEEYAAEEMRTVVQDEGFSDVITVIHTP